MSEEKGLMLMNKSHDNPDLEHEIEKLDQPSKTNRISLDDNDVSPGMIEETLARRAAKIAREIEEVEQGEQVMIVPIRLGSEVYGLDVRYVRDIRPLAYLTRVPRVPKWVAGVVNLHGRVFSVIDLLRFFGLAHVEKEDGEGETTRYLVVVEIPEMEIALLSDEVLPIGNVPVKRIQDTTNTVLGIRKEYMRGIVVDEMRSERTSTPDKYSNFNMLVILDLPVLLSDKQLLVQEEIV